MKKQTICLCMIVKNESHIILETLTSVQPYIDYWVICDTGSTDDTVEIVEKFFREAGVPGELHQVEWKNFGYNRSQTFELAFNKGDYLWVIDADDVLVGSIDLLNLEADSYRLKYVLGSITYYRDQLFRGDLHWEYKGVLHEYPQCCSKEQSSKGMLRGDYYIQARTVGGRNLSDPRQKYLADAQILENALLEETDTGLTARYLFYLAQSYRDAGEYDKAIQRYRDRINAGGWVEEVWYSLFQIGKLYEYLTDIDQAKLAYLAAFEYRPVRAESLHSLGKLCNLRREFAQAAMFLEQAVKIAYPDDILFVSKNVYEYEIDFELSISTYWIGDYQRSVELCNKLIDMKESIHPAIYEQTLKNREFGLAKIASSKTV